jgi:hypothetical protein
MHFAQARRQPSRRPRTRKGNSEGEFGPITRSASPTASSALYYPKLVVARCSGAGDGPAPARQTGRSRRRGFRRFQRRAKLAERADLRRACSSVEAQAVLLPSGACSNAGLQYWHNAGYATFDDFLARFDAKHRHQIRRERRELERCGVGLDALTGSICAFRTPISIRSHAGTVDKFRGGGAISRANFQEVLASMPSAPSSWRRNVRASASSRRVQSARPRHAVRSLPVASKKFRSCTSTSASTGASRKRSRAASGPGPAPAAAQVLPRLSRPSRTACILCDERLRAAIEDYLSREVRAVDDEVEEVSRCSSTFRRGPDEPARVSARSGGSSRTSVSPTRGRPRCTCSPLSQVLGGGVPPSGGGGAAVGWRRRSRRADRRRFPGTTRTHRSRCCSRWSSCNAARLLASSWSTEQNPR